MGESRGDKVRMWTDIPLHLQGGIQTRMLTGWGGVMLGGLGHWGGVSCWSGLWFVGFLEVVGCMFCGMKAGEGWFL
jgi:hypothetical protein